MSEVAVSHSNVPRPLTSAEFNSLMKACGPFPESPRFAIAVSGGPDSIALLFMLHDWVMQHGGTLHAITVDHQLRAESSDEAAQVKQWCAERSFSHATLVWEKDSNPQSAVHHQARKARYELLCHACKQQNLDYLFLGHHADDQAETVLMRIIKGSGIDGLAGMPKTRRFDGIKIIRPFLPIIKQRLVDTCMAHSWSFFHDPSNDSSAYLRGRLRQLAAPLAEEGLNTASLFELARSAGTARAALEASTNEWLQRHVTTNTLGVIQMDVRVWKSLDDEHQRRTLIRILLCMSGEDYAPKNTSLDVLIQSLNNKETLHQTLCGCHIIVQLGLIKFYRELAAAPPSMPAGPVMLWDNRFKVVIDESLLNQDLVIAPLGERSRDQLEKMGYRQVADCPALHRSTLPALYVDNQLHSVPYFGANEEAVMASQALVKAIFLPKRMLLIDCFDVCSVLLS